MTWFLYLRSIISYGLPHGLPYGLAVRISGFHPGGPGSTPGMGTYFLRVQTLEVFFSVCYEAPMPINLNHKYQSESVVFK